MRLYRNIASGKLFICIDENGDKLVLITPQGDVKGLETSLFEEIGIEEMETDQVQKMLTGAQVKKYEQYIDTLMPKT